jgi:hypothetical protein
LIRRFVAAPKFVIAIREGRDVASSLAKRFGNLQVGIDRWVDENKIVLSEADQNKENIKTGQQGPTSLRSGPAKVLKIRRNQPLIRARVRTRTTRLPEAN